LHTRGAIIRDTIVSGTKVLKKLGHPLPRRKLRSLYLKASSQSWACQRQWYLIMVDSLLPISYETIVLNITSKQSSPPLLGPKPMDKLNSKQAILWFTRTTTKSMTGKTPFMLVYGSELVLPIEVVIHTHEVSAF